MEARTETNAVARTHGGALVSPWDKLQAKGRATARTGTGTWDSGSGRRFLCQPEQFFKFLDLVSADRYASRFWAFHHDDILVVDLFQGLRMPNVY